MSYPWLQDQCARLDAAHAAGRMPHALLIHDAPGAGGEWLAGWAAQRVLCTAQAAAPCGQCVACRGVAARQHPDLLHIGLVEDSKQIRIDQVRLLIDELGLTSHRAGGYKVGIVAPADQLNRSAANALLKTLEEPPPRTLVVLVALQPSRLPATLISRCQRVRVRPPSRAQSLAWLQAAHGKGDWNAVLDVVGEAPLIAAELDPAELARVDAETRRALRDALSANLDPVATAERWRRSQLPLRLRCVENWLTECIRRSTGALPQTAELSPGAHTAAPADINVAAAFALLNRVQRLRAALDTPLNPALALESLLRLLGEAGQRRVRPSTAVRQRI